MRIQNQAGTRCSSQYNTGGAFSIASLQQTPHSESNPAHTGSKAANCVKKNKHTRRMNPRSPWMWTKLFSWACAESPALNLHISPANTEVFSTVLHINSVMLPLITYWWIKYKIDKRKLKSDSIISDTFNVQSNYFWSALLKYFIIII